MNADMHQDREPEPTPSTPLDSTLDDIEAEAAIVPPGKPDSHQEQELSAPRPATPETQGDLSAARHNVEEITGRDCPSSDIIESPESSPEGSPVSSSSFTGAEETLFAIIRMILQDSATLEKAKKKEQYRWMSELRNKRKSNIDKRAEMLKNILDNFLQLAKRREVMTEKEDDACTFFHLSHTPCELLLIVTIKFHSILSCLISMIPLIRL